MTNPSGSSREALRRRVLAENGATPDEIDQLLEFTECSLDLSKPVDPVLPLDDEAHLEAWSAYAEEAEQASAAKALRSRLVQLNFPVREGISGEADYRSATLRGVLPSVMSRSQLQLEEPDRLQLVIHESIGGRIPVLVTDLRRDFELLVQAFTARGEPRPVPESMGACMVSGLNNWDRIRSHRRAWEEREDTAGDDAAWNDEFKRLLPRKQLYQDRLIILSRGPYSGVSAADVQLGEDEWLDLSHRIRLEHECTHYLTLRVFGRLQHNVVEELVADFAGLIRARGRFSRDLAARFLGLEAYPVYRAGGRLENYRGNPPITDAAFPVIQSLAHQALGNLARIDGTRRPSNPADLARLVLDLARLSLEELADPALSERLEARPL